MIFTSRRKTLCITFLILAGFVLIGTGVMCQDLPHRISPIVLGGALIAVGIYIVTIEPGEHPRR